MRWTGNVARNRAKSNAYRILVGKQEAKRPLGRPRHRWDDNIKMYLREIGLRGKEWIHLGSGKGPVAGSCEHGNESSGSIKCWGNLQ
jgi:hypothetical protein